MVVSERQFDYLYDSSYVLSSQRDFLRATHKAQMKTSNIKYVPVLENLFSDLKSCQRFTVCIQKNDKIPKSMLMNWAPHAPNTQDFSNHKFVASNYIFRPLLSYVQRHHMELWTTSEHPEKSQITVTPLHTAISQKRINTTTNKNSKGGINVAVQTIYRESECQTDPYTPAHKICTDIFEKKAVDYVPEILTLASLSYNKGLPVGLAEVEMIERARIKREWEKQLPPLNDVAHHDKRMRMMEEIERKEWAFREAEIDRLQEARIELLKRILCEREQKTFNLKNECLERIWNQRKEDSSKAIRKIRNEHVKDLRKLFKKHQTSDKQKVKRDIIQEYCDPASTVYAPLMRNGVFIDRNSEKYVIKSKYLDSYQGLCELEKWLPNKLIRVDINLTSNNVYTNNGFIKRSHRKDQMVADIHRMILEEKKQSLEGGVEEKHVLRFMEKIEKPAPRPITPTIEFPNREYENSELAVIDLQRLIRGRAIQNLMYESKNDRIEFIKELRSTHALLKHEKSIIEADKKKINNELKGFDRLTEKKRNVANVIGKLESNVLASTLDFLSKELVRLQEEQKIQAFSLLASRQRRTREAEESGKRQMEMRRALERDYMFKELVKINQHSVDNYLQDVIISSIDECAETVSRKNIEMLSEKINDVAYELEKRNSNAQIQETVSELVHSFLIPEVRKCDYRNKVKSQQRKYIFAAHKEIYKNVNNTDDEKDKETKK